MDRFEHVIKCLTTFVLQKHNGFVTRLSEGKTEEVISQIRRIVGSEISRFSETGKQIFSQIRKTNKVKLAPLLEAEGTDTSFSFLSSVRFTECCSVSEYLPKPEYRRRKAEEAVYEPDETSLPEMLEAAIRRFYEKHNIKCRKPTWLKVVRFLNYLWGKSGEGRLGIESLKKMGFTNHSSRQHIKHLETMGVIVSEGYCPVAGISKLYRLREPATKMFAEGRSHGVAQPAQD